jgi:beta-mannosidase
VLVPARGALTLNAEAMVGYFADSAAAYRFGPPRHEVIVARLQDVEGRTLSEDFHFPAGMDLPVRYPQVRGEARREADGRVTVTLSSDAFIQASSLTCEGYVPDDNYFHLVPGHEKRVAFLPAAGCDGRFEAILEALNLAAPVAVRIERDAGDRAA